MPDLVKFGFSGGVFSPKLSMRSDLKKFDLGLAFARNFFVEYTGGISTRPGTEFIDYIQDDTEPARIVQFAFNRAISNTYAILFSKNRIRFLQDGRYVLETAKTITSATSTTITLNTHGYSNGDWVKIQGDTYAITAVTPNTFQLTYPRGGAVTTTGFGGKSVARIYTLASPYATADLSSLSFSQYRDVLYINSVDYPEKKLTRFGATNWTLTNTSLDVNGNVPTGLTLTPSAAGSYGAVFAVTMVDQNGRESYIGSGAIALNRLCVNYTTTAGHMGLAWTKPAGGNVSHYKVYRSLFMPGTELHYGLQLGFIGQTTFPKFTDSNIVPDFSHTPPEINLPIAGGQMPILTVSAGGSGYTDNSTISPSGGGGVAWSGKPIVEAGAIVGVRVLNPGFGYSGSPVSFTATVGTGATITATPTALTGNNPAASAMIQQRRVRAGTVNYPGTLFGSRVGEPDNFYSSGRDLATDPYALSLDSEQLTPINYILPYPEGAFIFQNTGVTQVRGVDDGVIKVGSAKAQELTEEGSAKLQPIKIKRDYLYLNAAKTSVYALAPSNLPQYYVPTDISIYSEHYFTQDNPIVSWTWAKSPHKILWAARQDGSFLSLTYVSEQEVAAWCEHSTQGYVEDVETVTENELDRVYMIVRRVVGGAEVRYIERMALQDVDTPDEVWAVDCGLRTSLTYPTASISLLSRDSFGYSGPGTVRAVKASSAVFSNADVGKVFRMGKTRGTIVSYYSTTMVFVSFDRYFSSDEIDLETIELQVWPQGSWSLASYINSVSGLSHLNGLLVDILGDGNELTQKYVTVGTVPLSQDVSYAVIGLPYTSRMRTLPLTASDAAIEGKYKSTKNLAVRLFNSLAVEFGDAPGDVLFPILPRPGDPLSTAQTFLDGMYEISIAAAMTLDGAIVAEKRGPQQATILGYVAEIEIGD